MTNRSVTTFFRFLVTGALLVLVFYKAGLLNAADRLSLIELIKSVNIRYLVLSVILGVTLNLASVIKWYMLLNAKKVKAGFLHLYALYMVGRFFNLILPTSVGGDVVRIYELGRVTQDPAESAASVFMERFSGIVTLMIIAVMVVLVNLKTFNIPIITISLSLGTIAILMIGWMVIDSRPFEVTKKIFYGKFHIIDKLFIKIEKIQMAVMAYKSHPPALWMALLNSLIFYFLAVVNVWISALAFHPDVDFIKLIVAVPVLLLIMNLPISIGGIGLMEFAYTLIFDLMGYSPALGLSTALLMRAKTLIDAGIGALLYPVISKGRSIKSEIKKKKSASSPTIRQ